MKCPICGKTLIKKHYSNHYNPTNLTSGIDTQECLENDDKHEAYLDNSNVWWILYPYLTSFVEIGYSPSIKNEPIYYLLLRDSHLRVVESLDIPPLNMSDAIIIIRRYINLKAFL